MGKQGVAYWDKKLIGPSPTGVINQYVKWRDAHDVFIDPDSGKKFPIAYCITCKKPVMKNNLQAGHWISRRHKGVAYDEHNIHAQCGGCNKWNNGEPQMHEDEMRLLYGDEEVDRIRSWLGKTRLWTPGELEDLYDEYKHKLDKLKH